MIRAAASSARLVQRVRAAAERIATIRAAAISPRSRRDHRTHEGSAWRSASALWPDFTTDPDRN